MGINWKTVCFGGGGVWRSVGASISSGERGILSEYSCCTYREKSGESSQVHRKSKSVFNLCWSQQQDLAD
jgi:hypothetical protein